MFNILERMQPKPVDTTPLAVRELGCMLSALVRLGELHAHIASPRASVCVAPVLLAALHPHPPCCHFSSPTPRLLKRLLRLQGASCEAIRPASATGAGTACSLQAQQA